MNAAMCTDVVSMLSPELQALVQTSGKVGARAFQECVARGMVAIYTQAYTHDVTTTTTSVGEHDEDDEEDPWSAGVPALELIPVSSASIRRSSIPTRRLVLNHSFLTNREDAGYSLQFPGSDTIEIIACTSFHFIDHVSRGDRRSVTAHIFNADNCGYEFMASRCRLESFSLLEWSPNAVGVVDEGGNNLITLTHQQQQLRNQHNNNHRRSQFTPPPPPTSTMMMKKKTLTHIREGFLKHSKIRTINLDALRNVSTVESEFLMGTNLSSIDLSPLAVLRSIGAHFMSNSPLLMDVDLSPCIQVVEVGSHFLWNCAVLKRVDMSAMVILITVGGRMMEKCPSLSHVYLPHNAPLDDPRNAPFLHKYTPQPHKETSSSSTTTPLYINDVLVVASPSTADCQRGCGDGEASDVWDLLGC